MGQTTTTKATSPRDVAALVEQHVGGPRRVPESGPRVSGRTDGDAGGLFVTDLVDDILELLGTRGRGEPEAGVAISVQLIPAHRQRRLLADLHAWDGMYVLFPDGSTRANAVTVRFRSWPELKVVFRANAVASVDDRGVWTIDAEVTR